MINCHGPPRYLYRPGKRRRNVMQSVRLADLETSAYALRVFTSPSDNAILVPTRQVIYPVIAGDATSPLCGSRLLPRQTEWLLSASLNLQTRTAQAHSVPRMLVDRRLIAGRPHLINRSPVTADHNSNGHRSCCDRWSGVIPPMSGCYATTAVVTRIQASL